MCTVCKQRQLHSLIDRIVNLLEWADSKVWTWANNYTYYIFTNKLLDRRNLMHKRRHMQTNHTT